MATSGQRVVNMCKNQDQCRDKATCHFYHPKESICNFGLSCVEQSGDNPKCRRKHYEKKDGYLIVGKMRIKPFTNRPHHDAPKFTKKQHRDIVEEYNSAKTDDDANRLYVEAKKIVANAHRTIENLTVIIKDFEEYCAGKKTGADGAFSIEVIESVDEADDYDDPRNGNTSESKEVKNAEPKSTEVKEVKSGDGKKWSTIVEDAECSAAEKNKTKEDEENADDY